MVQARFHKTTTDKQLQATMVVITNPIATLVADQAVAEATTAAVVVEKDVDVAHPRAVKAKLATNPTKNEVATVPETGVLRKMKLLMQPPEAM